MSDDVEKMLKEARAADESRSALNARIESILATLFGRKPRGGGGRVGRWYCMRNLAKYLIQSPDRSRSITEIQYNWAAQEGLTPQKALELIEHLLNMTGPNGETVCKNLDVGGIRFVKWVFGFGEDE